MKPMKEIAIVKTKTGKMYYFDNLPNAYIFAESQSKKLKTTYVVYSNGRAEAAYANGHKLAEFSTLAEKVMGKTKIKLEKDDTKLRLRIVSETYKYWTTDIEYGNILGYFENGLMDYHRTCPRNIGELYLFMLSEIMREDEYDQIIFEYTRNEQRYEIEAPIVADIKIIKDCYKNGMHNNDEIFGRTIFYKMIHDARLIFRTHGFHAESYTIHRDKKTYKSENGKVRRVYELPELIDNSMVRIIFNWLCQYDENLRLLALDDVYMQSQYILNPNKYLEFDVYRNNVEFKRNMSSPIKDMDSIYPLQVMEHKNVQDFIIKKFRLPDAKSFRKLYNEDERYYIATAVARKFGFKNIDLLRLLTDKIYKKWMYNDSIHYQIVKNKINLNYIKDLISSKGEKIAERVISEDLNMAIDVCRMYEEADHLLRAFVVSNAHNIMDAHETFVYYSQRTRRENTVFAYTKEQKKCEDEIGDITFYLPKDAFTLASIGAELKICVGSYTSAIKYHYTTVLAMKCRDKNIACLEINNGELIQIKQTCNNPLRQEFKDVVTRYFTKHKVKYHECPDYKRIGSVWNNHHDYHVVDPNMIRRNEENDYKLEIIKYRPYQLPEDYLVF